MSIPVIRAADFNLYVGVAQQNCFLTGKFNSKTLISQVLKLQKHGLCTEEYMRKHHSNKIPIPNQVEKSLVKYSNSYENYQLLLSRLRMFCRKQISNLTPRTLNLCKGHVNELLYKILCH